MSDIVLRQRKAVVTVDTLQVTCDARGLRCTFDVDKDLTGHPNTAGIRIFNLTEDHRNAILAKANKQAMRVRLDAGYEDNCPRLFEGDIRLVDVERSGPDAALYIEAGDGDIPARNARIYRSWGPGSPAETVLRDVAKALGVGEGNLSTVIRGAVLEGWGPTFTQGTAAAGSAVKKMTSLCRSCGLEWSIQDGNLQLLARGASLDRTAVVISQDTGLIGNPQHVSLLNRSGKPGKKNRSGVIKVKTLMIPDLFPGRKIEMRALEITGFYTVQKAKYSGDSAGNEWYIDLEAKELS